ECAARDRVLQRLVSVPRALAKRLLLVPVRIEYLLDPVLLIARQIELTEQHRIERPARTAEPWSPPARAAGAATGPVKRSARALSADILISDPGHERCDRCHAQCASKPIQSARHLLLPSAFAAASVCLL